MILCLVADSLLLQTQMKINKKRIRNQLNSLRAFAFPATFKHKIKDLFPLRTLVGVFFLCFIDFFYFFPRLKAKRSKKMKKTKQRILPSMLVVETRPRIECRQTFVYELQIGIVYNYSREFF